MMFRIGDGLNESDLSSSDEDDDEEEGLKAVKKSAVACK